MALQFADRVLQTGTANTTVSFTLTGTVVGYQAFSTLTTGNTTYYAATDGTNWETGLGTLTSSTLLTRTTVLQSSNSNTAVTFSGTVTVWVDYPSSKSVNLDANNILSLPNQSLTATLNSGVIAVGGVMNFSDTGIVMSSVASTNSYFQNVIQNTSSGTQASAEFIAYNNNGTASTNFATVGINSSGYTGVGAVNASGYAYFLSGSTDMVLGTIGSNNVHVVTNSQATDAITVNTSNAVAFGGSYGTTQYVLMGQGSTASPIWIAQSSITAGGLATGNNYQVNSLGVGTAASGTTGEIRATNNVTAYYSDDRMKTRLGNINGALDKLKTLDGFYYEANDLAQSMGYEVKREVGVSAQQVQAIMPEVVAPAPINDNYLTVRYERLVPLLIEAIKELEAQVAELKGK